MKKLTFLFILPLLVCGFYVGSVNTVHELRTIINPHGGMTNLFVKEINSIVSWSEGDATATNTLPDGPFDSLKGTGRWYPVIKAFGGTITNIQITTNITVVLPGATNYVELWMITNGVMQPVHLDLPLFWTNMVVLGPGMTNVLYRSGADMNLTNSGTETKFSLVNGAGNSASLAIDSGGVPELLSSTATLYLRQTGGASGIVLNNGNFGPITPNAIDSGISTVPYKDGAWQGTIYSIGFNSNTNYSRLAISHSGTNGAVVLDSQSAGTAGTPRPIALEFGGTNLFQFDGAGNMTFGPGTTNVLFRTNGYTLAYESPYTTTAGQNALQLLFGGTNRYLFDSTLNGLGPSGLNIYGQNASNSVMFGANVSGNTAYVRGGVGGAVIITPNTAASGSVHVQTTQVVPDTDNQISLGSTSSTGSFKDSYFKGEQHMVGENDGSGNYSWVRMFVTNGIAVFDFKNNGTGTVPTKFSFRTNGVEVGTFP